MPGAVLLRAVAVGRAAEQELVEVRAHVVGGVPGAAGLDVLADLAELLEAVDGPLDGAGVAHGVVRQGGDGGPGPSVAVVVGDAEDDELVGGVASTSRG